MTEARNSMPIGWAETNLGTICNALQYGYTASARHEPCGPKFLRITDIQDGQVQWHQVPFCEIAEEQVAKYELYPGDIVFARTGGTVGKSYIIGSVPERSIFASYLIRVRPHSLVDSKFLYYFFQSVSYWSQIGLKKGGLQGNVNASTLSSLKLLLCPLREQQRIVAKLEELLSGLDKGIESLEAARQQLNVYRQAVLKRACEGALTAQWRDENPDKILSPDELLNRLKKERESSYQEQLDRWKTALKSWEAGERSTRTRPTKPARPRWPKEASMAGLKPLPPGWAYAPFEALAYSIRNGTSQKPSGEGTLKIFRISAVRPMRFNLTDYRRLPDDEQFERYKLERGDLVFTRYNGSRSYVGVAALYRGDGSHVYPDKLIRCQIRSDLLNAGYLEKAVNCGESRAFIERRIRTTAGQAGISGADLKAMPVPICSPEEQAEISRILETTIGRIEGLESEVDAALLKSRALRESILEKAFAGQLVAQDPNDEPASALLERIRAGHEDEPSIRKNRSRRDAA